MIDLRLGRFAAVGAANTAFGLLVVFVAKAVFDVGDVAANAVGYATAIGLGFALNRTWTFNHRGEPYTAFVRYLFVLACAYVANLLTVVYAIHVRQLDGYLAQMLGILPYAATNYLGSRLFAFPDTKGPVRATDAAQRTGS